ncbi:MAG TPA: [protein-PII] uridylyltransferase [Planctomycetota bacterium]
MTSVQAPANPLRDLLQKGRASIRAVHEGGAQGGQVSSALTDLYDRVISASFLAAVERLPGDERARALRELSLVAIGGYGRGDTAPFSDVDLLILTARRPSKAILDLVGGLVRDLWDLGLKLSQSVRTPADSVDFARRDLPHFTALAEARQIAGAPALFHELQRKLQRHYHGMALGRFIDAVLEERKKEHQDYFATTSLLEPNVKKSPGGLRDIHLLRWIAQPRYGTRDPELLRVSGVLTAEDARTVGEVGEFLSRIRHELHFKAGGASDVLTRDEQVRISKWLGFENQGALLGVERFMMRYHRHTTALHDLVSRFAHGARRRTGLTAVFNRVVRRRVGDHYLLDRDVIALDPAAPPEVLKRADVLLDLFDLARRNKVHVAHESLERARTAVPACEITPAAREKFLRIMAEPVGLGILVRELHRIGLLGRFIPAFEHARCLLQWNQYHKYTVDEHSIRALEAALFRYVDEGPVGQAYRETKRKDVLHLALLLHDIGKGYEEDHSEVGKRIAEELATLLGLGELERGQLVFLVHKHLAMAHVSQRRDLSDEATILQFVREVKTVEALRMMYVLTVADTEAVAPGSLTAWKESLLTELYSRSMEELTGTAPVADEAGKVEKIREALREKLAKDFEREWLRAQLAAMPATYLRTTAPADVAAHLLAIKGFDPKGVSVAARWLPDMELTEYVVVVRDDLTPGIFSKIAGALAAERLGIHGAQIVTRADGLVLDSFLAEDPDFKAEPPAGRRAEVGKTIEDVLLGRKSVEALFAARPVPPRPARENHPSTGGPPQAAIDNGTSDRCTIVEIFADDRQGLLYEITHALFEMGLSIASAKISTRLDQVVDAFYVTERATGGKVPDERVGAIVERLRAVITSA